MAGRAWRENAVLQKLAIWFVFTVIVTLAPFFLGFFQSIDRDQQFTFSLILGTGQLLLVSVAIAAAALGDLVAIEVSTNQRILKTVAIGSCTLVVIISSLWFGDISATIQGKPVPDPRTISFGSGVVYFWALVSSAWCLSLATIKGEPAPVGGDEETTLASPLREIQQDKEK
jgi:hypothetical protein